MTTAMNRVRTWAEMIKLSHSVFALPFALIAAFLAGRHLEPLHRPSWGQLALIIWCMIAARSVAMTFNRIADAGIDARNPRTENRPLPTGRLSMTSAWVFVAICAAALALGCVLFEVFFENPWPIRLCAPVLVYICGYSYAKRFTRLAHLYLGSAIALSPLAAWIAVHPPSIGWPTAVLAGAVTLWIAGFDIIYACQDVAVDRHEGLHSLPAGLGPARALWIARVCHLFTVALLGLLAHIAGLGWVYLIGAAIVAVLLAIENSLVRADDLSRVNLAFFTLNGAVSLVLGGLAIADILLGMQPVY
ncbi:MAG: UbiA family prenyltransferase [bacterium]|nr:UbiA family prenyltransferase [bacterium]